ncbi:MAG: hypothetical protein PHQ81_10885 [Methanofollis sp.]|nr:hypothetical protein [Methanofollis sp.]
MGLEDAIKNMKGELPPPVLLCGKEIKGQLAENFSEDSARFPGRISKGNSLDPETCNGTNLFCIPITEIMV